MTVAQAGALGGRRSHGGGRQPKSVAAQVAAIDRRARRTNENPADEIAELEALQRKVARKPRAKKATAPKATPKAAPKPRAPRKRKVSAPLAGTAPTPAQIRARQVELYNEAVRRFNQELAFADSAPPGSMVHTQRRQKLVRDWHIRPPYDGAAVQRGIWETVGREFDKRYGGF